MSNRTVVGSKKSILFPLIPVDVWDFSVACYSIGEVKCACFDLQEHYGGSIGLILLLKFLVAILVALANRSHLLEIHRLLHDAVHSRRFTLNLQRVV